MRWQVGRGSGNISDRRGMGGAGLAGGGVGAVVLALIGYFVFGDPNALSGMQGAAAPPAQQGAAGQPADDQGRFVSQILGSTEEVWGQAFAASGSRYTPPQTVLYEQATRTGCGVGQAAMGPFYCPADRGVYIDLSFFRQLDQQLGAPGDFARAYVIAHEVGHHVQTLTGASDMARRMGAQGEESGAVRLELQADCYAGVWAAQSNRTRQWLEPGDVEEGLRAAAAVGDDTLQRRSRGTVVPDSFTHGTSEQRARWFRTGLQTGDPASCDTFRAPRL
ncbi:MAG TPA: neutral zinc metallopeptidase [Caulobacteraceae bacterium]|nr:neutral zinc metallopeptidase [Caulobacteraceae bacterium]